MIVQWREQFTLGRAAVDADHRLIADTINDLDTAIAVASPPEVVGRALDLLAQRIDDHFRREDDEVPACDGHDRPVDHQLVLARVRRLRDEWRQGACTEFDRGQLLALARWWVDHLDAAGRVN